MGKLRRKDTLERVMGRYTGLVILLTGLVTIIGSTGLVYHGQQAVTESLTTGLDEVADQLALAPRHQSPSLVLAPQRATMTRELKRATGATNPDLQLAVVQASDVRYAYRGQDVLPTEHRQLLAQLAPIGAVNADLRTSYHFRQRRLPDGSRLIALTAKQAVTQRQTVRILRLVGMATLVDAVLIRGLWLTFRRYRHRLAAVSGTLDDTGRPVADVGAMTTAVERLLTDVQQYGHQVNQPQSTPNQANLQRLQAQIKPHFLYNTLEYIRMYAVAEAEPELANVVVAFATLLRSDADQAPVATLDQEISFVRKYMYLYQMRFPDQVAYGFQVEPQLATLRLPKLILQPIVENYFMHGIDYSRQDNAIDVRGWVDEDDRVRLQVRDNGKGMTPAALAGLRQQLTGSLGAEQRRQHIGMRNVLERLRSYFGASADLTVQTNAMGGLTVELAFLKEGGLNA
ncbi:sensor histidine kinase [Lactiplantibacillus plajomi]|uniref:Sensor histidine kinase n=1 Tax=Lactiplantibacillus plajomi TaxID=1457217 RepID=A0ABV6K7Y8_9LACO|nr:sensor histidine kinase [Lactiplantibacillus plajomi]